VDWKPRTELGKEVNEGKITSIDYIFENGLRIKEPQIVERLLPDLKSEVIFIGGSPGKGGGIKRTPTRRTARMHRSGRRYKISACVIVGRPGYIGIGKAASKEHSTAINKATQYAKLSLIQIRRGCGSWECACEEAHSLPLKITGKGGSVRVTLMPAPKGIGLCIGDEEKKMLKIAGIRDIWSKVSGETKTRLNYAYAIYNALKNLNKLKLDLKIAKDKEEIKINEEATASSNMQKIEEKVPKSKINAEEKIEEIAEEELEIEEPSPEELLPEGAKEEELE